MYVKIFPGVVRYWASGTPCKCIAAMVDVAHPFFYDHLPFFAIQNSCFVLMVQVSGIYVASMVNS